MVGHRHSGGGGKDGDTFKCGAAALIHWVKMGEEERQRSDCRIIFYSSLQAVSH